ncbi:hypothetical protein [Kushneria phyllosphaerae]|uniref:Uncharacterized protein n=1 Tax=Kushneria phyllosphaerae TaxID=2100822 RepID=A0A2R8CIJ1_9GAMM|nr:hypothetical protein [Kushneria phyllosphaerae]SPJ32700.1 hypothetical protein KSP9073_00701 [Kushneria phyllosphaerae]
MKAKTAKKRIERALKKSCPDRIKITGKEDCYSVYINNDDGSENLLVKRVKGDNLLCKEWFEEERVFTRESHIAISKTTYRNYEVVHHYKGAVLFHNGLENFSYSNSLKKRVLVNKSILARAFRQYLFNKRDILVEDRVNILRTLVDMYLENTKDVFSYTYRSTSFDAGTYLTRKNGQLWYRHPNSRYEHIRVKLILDSLSETGDLNKTKDGYSITPKALKTLSDYDEEERKHRSLLTPQVITAALTFVVACGTVAQAYIAYWK